MAIGRIGSFIILTLERKNPRLTELVFVDAESCLNLLIFHVCDEFHKVVDVSECDFSVHLVFGWFKEQTFPFPPFSLEW